LEKRRPSPRLGDLVAKDLSEEQVLDLVEKDNCFLQRLWKAEKARKSYR
jgi:hypothetical protein